MRKYARSPIAPKNEVFGLSYLTEDGQSLSGKTASGRVIRRNHFSSTDPISTAVKTKIASMGLERIAGNVYACPSKQDFWAVKGNKIIKLVVDEVDDGSSIPAAPSNSPMDFLTNVLDDLTL